MGKEYIKDLRRNAKKTVRVYKGEKAVECLAFKVNKSKKIINEFDRMLAQYYGFTEEELDFIINYDIKFRVGLDETS